MPLLISDKSNRLQPASLFLEPNVFGFSSMGGLALSELTTQRQPVKTDFDPVQDRAQVLQILHRPSLTAAAVL